MSPQSRENLDVSRYSCSSPLPKSTSEEFRERARQRIIAIQRASKPVMQLVKQAPSGRAFYQVAAPTFEGERPQLRIVPPLAPSVENEEERRERVLGYAMGILVAESRERGGADFDADSYLRTIIDLAQRCRRREMKFHRDKRRDEAITEE